MKTYRRDGRLYLHDGTTAAGENSFARDVVDGLGAMPKRLPCVWFYDEVGSRLFDRICGLPEYYLTRAEDRIIRDAAPEIAATMSRPPMFVELGSGSAAKTRRLIDGFLGRHGSLLFVPVDISCMVLQETSNALRREYPDLAIDGFCCTYEDALAHLANGWRDDRPLVLAWLGSSIGNFDRADAVDFLGRMRADLRDDDRALIGIDLRKDRELLLRAYDDAQGVTAEFNRNLLARINRALGGEFDLSAFRHRAEYDEEEGVVRMYLVSERAQSVRIAALEMVVHFAASEAIHTEDSYKYSAEEIDELADRAGFRVERRWLDPARLFSVNMFAPA